MVILFIDDDPDDTELFCEALNYLNSSDLIAAEKEAIECLTASNGRKAIELLSSLSKLPDYIFLDVNMPVMGGKECLKYLKANSLFSHVPVIMLSTALRPEDADEFLTLGAVECIRKPSGFTALVKVLSKFVYRKYGEMQSGC